MAGRDYERHEYPPGCAVVDNPPFSILEKIRAFYCARGIPFFLFAPGLTCINARSAKMENHIIGDVAVTYENGAIVATAFVTNMGDGRTVIQTAPDLFAAVEAANRAEAKPKATAPKYDYPDNVVTAARLRKVAARGIGFSIERAAAFYVDALDSQRAAGKDIFGGGLLISSKAAAEKVAAEKAAAEKVIVWKLSPRECAIVEALDKAGETGGFFTVQPRTVTADDIPLKIENMTQERMDEW